mmetsp:Transcript_43954/g.110790  ORF Transcript_43954/g.110790 Transcript_43954/m.110790 type:complete len:247 (+) Transcript_43954:372-1112(+)
MPPARAGWRWSARCSVGGPLRLHQGLLRQVAAHGWLCAWLAPRPLDDVMKGKDILVTRKRGKRSGYFFKDSVCVAYRDCGSLLWASVLQCAYKFSEVTRHWSKEENKRRPRQLHRHATPVHAQWVLVGRVCDNGYVSVRLSTRKVFEYRSMAWPGDDAAESLESIVGSPLFYSTADLRTIFLNYEWGDPPASQNSGCDIVLHSKQCENGDVVLIRDENLEEKIEGAMVSMVQSCELINQMMAQLVD